MFKNSNIHLKNVRKTNFLVWFYNILVLKIFLKLYFAKPVYKYLEIYVQNLR